MNNEKKTCKLTLISHYFGRELTIRMDATLAARLMSKSDPIDEINLDLERISYGIGGHYLSKGQARKIDSYNTDMDYFDRVVLA